MTEPTSIAVDETATTGLFSKLRDRRSLVLVIVAAVVGLFVVREASALIFGPPRAKGPDSSSFATSRAGLAALAELAHQQGFNVEQRRYDLAGSDVPPLDPSTVLAVFDTELDPNEVANVARFVISGGQLVTGGRGATWIIGLTRPLRYGESSDEPVGTGTVDQPDLFGGAKVLAVPSPIYFAAYPGVQLASVGDRTIATEVPLGAGTIRMVADPSLFSNSSLAKADNAAFALAMLGKPGDTIVFAEAGHGYRISTGTATGLPWRLRWFLVFSLFATVLGMIVKGRRNGPPERPHRVLPPPRSDYIYAVAANIHSDSSSKAPSESPSNARPS